MRGAAEAAMLEMSEARVSVVPYHLDKNEPCGILDIVGRGQRQQ